MEVSANPGLERRKSPRITLTKILYVNLESGNGGIVLNVSDGGLAFHSVAPLTHNGPVRLWFSLSNDHRFEVSGELVWSNQTKKTGGLRFTNLTDSDRAQIRSLAGDATPLSAMPAFQPQPLHAGHDDTSVEREAISQDALTQQAPVVDTQEPAIQDPAPRYSGGIGSFSHSILHADEAPQSPQPKDDLPTSDAFKYGYGQYGYARANKSWAAPPPLESSGPSLGRVFIMLIGTLVLVAAAVALYSHSGEVGAALVRVGQRLQGGSRDVSQAAPQVPPQIPSSQVSGQATSSQAASRADAQVASLADQSPATQVQPGTSAPTSAAPDTPALLSTAKNSQVTGQANTSSENVPASSASDAKAAPHTSRVFRQAMPPVPPEKGPSPSQRQAIAQADDSDSAADLDIAERYLNGIGRSRNSAAAAQFLWAAVAKGNATAELTLAHLYLNGDGVGRSCEQARLLLQAAASKGDLEANETLANLGRERCR